MDLPRSTAKPRSFIVSQHLFCCRSLRIRVLGVSAVNAFDFSPHQCLSVFICGYKRTRIVGYPTLTYQCENEIATIALTVPEKRNAISSQMIADLLRALQQADEGPARVVIITGSGKAFCAGMDLDELQRVAKQTQQKNLEDARRITKMFYRLYSFPKPVIAAVNGAADRRRMRHRHSRGFHARRSRSQIRIHRGQARIHARAGRRLPPPPDRRPPRARSAADRKNH